MEEGYQMERLEAELWIVGQVGLSQIENWDTVPNLDIGPLNNSFFYIFHIFNTSKTVLYIVC